MYKINKATGELIFPDGFTLLPPYNDERYYEYAKWVHDGNSPEEIEDNSWLALEDVEVTPYQAREAMDQMEVMDEVQALLDDPATPRSIKTKFEYTLSFRRNDDAVIMMAQILGWSAQRLNELFALAKTLQ